eukprot:8968676-Pyramimonas_sp.AAC.1
MDTCHRDTLMRRRLPAPSRVENHHPSPAPAHKRASASGERAISRDQGYHKHEPCPPRPRGKRLEQGAWREAPMQS